MINSKQFQDGFLLIFPLVLMILGVSTMFIVLIKSDFGVNTFKSEFFNVFLLGLIITVWGFIETSLNKILRKLKTLTDEGEQK